MQPNGYWEKRNNKPRQTRYRIWKRENENMKKQTSKFITNFFFSTGLAAQKAIFGRNRNLIGSPCLLSTISLYQTLQRSWLHFEIPKYLCIMHFLMLKAYYDRIYLITLKFKAIEVICILNCTSRFFCKRLGFLHGMKI